MWYSLAATHSLGDAEVRSKSLNFDCTSYDSAQIAEANKLAREWKPKAP
jgi:hypothetical protein